jgi:hypothetical protein
VRDPGNVRDLGNMWPRDKFSLGTCLAWVWLGDYGLGNVRDLGKICPRDKWNCLAWVLVWPGYVSRLGTCLACMSGLGMATCA